MLILDLHLHSHYSRATSKNMDIENIYKWGKIKGINIIGTGDFTHPQWFAELQEKLEPAESGLFQLKKKYQLKIDSEIPLSCRHNLLRFILTTEISNIYKKNDRVRKLHNLIMLPDFRTVSKMISQLQQIGNLKSDGRPILGLDSKRLLAMTLASHPDSLFIPAHIWTPWFSMFGSKSGFDTIEEAFDELASEIKVVETGLSSDPFMNWRLKKLQPLTIVSNSDAHSPQKLGREANILNLAKLSYQEILAALKTNDQRFAGTIEFFPQEGKYHYDGHRKCNVCLSPAETKKKQGLCPHCHRPLVLGVDYRITELADFPENYRPKKHKKVEYIIPLTEILMEIYQRKSAQSTQIQEKYFQLIQKLGDEFNILRKVPSDEIAKQGFPELAVAIQHLRTGHVIVQPGYDGVYGTIKVFKNQAEINNSKGQIGLGF